MKTLLITLCKNEIDILPFVSQYWERLGCDVVVYDNGSIDGSLEYLAKLPYVTVKHFDSDGQNDVIQKTIKEQAFLEYKDKYDIIIISDLDEVFYFNDFKALSEAFANSPYNVLMTPIFSLCEDSQPPYSESQLLHQQCHKFYKQRMNHMQGFDDYSKLSIFNTKNTDKVEMSVGQHFVKTSPDMQIMLSNDGFCLHLNKGFGAEYYANARRKMGENLSETNIRGGMGVEYLYPYDKLIEDYKANQAKSFDINSI